MQGIIKNQNSRRSAGKSGRHRRFAASEGVGLDKQPAPCFFEAAGEHRRSPMGVLAGVDFAIAWSVLLALLLLVGYIVLTGPHHRR